MRFIFDTNIFIRSKNEMPMDLWPTFWLRMKELFNSGEVFVSVKVVEEIENGKDELVEWIHDNIPSTCIIRLDPSIISKFVEIQNWAASRPFTIAAKEDFAHVADAYLVATAAAKCYTLVTYEKPNPFSRKKVMIPDACNAIGVSFCDLNEVLKRMGMRI